VEGALSEYTAVMEANCTILDEKAISIEEVESFLFNSRFVPMEEQLREDVVGIEELCETM
jgi:hypothetical protein